MRRSIGTRPLLGAILLAVLSCPLASHAQQDYQAVVLTPDRAALEIGQAFLTHYGGRCHAVMPAHVAGEAARPALLREGAPALLGEASAVADLGDDIAVAQLQGAITTRCGPGALTIGRSVERLLSQGRLGTLRTINGDGTVAHLSVTIVDDDGRQFLRVQPTHQDNPIRKGLSGSRLMIEGAPVGMLLSVSARTGIGTVARIDALMAKVDEHLMNAGVASQPAPGSGARAGTGPSVIGWSALPISSANRAANLLATDDAAPWISEPANWPVTLDFELADGASILSGVVFDGTGVPDAGQLPVAAELYINPSGEARGWRSIGYHRLDWRDGSARLDFAPMRARMLRLSFEGPVDGGKIIALRRIVPTGR